MTEPSPSRPVPGPPRPVPGPVTEAAAPGIAAPEAAAPESLPTSGEPAYADLEERPVSEHVAVFDAEHSRLQRELGTIDQL